MIKIIHYQYDIGLDFETNVFHHKKIFNSYTHNYVSLKIQQLLKQISFHKVFLTFC